ncbi:MAG: alginate lyase family protein [Puniceicoccales bacterium]
MLDPVQEALAANDTETAKALYLDYRRDFTDSQWQELFRNHFHETRIEQNPVAIADAIVEGRVPVQGIIPPEYREDPVYIDLGETINWTANPVPTESPVYTREFEYYINRMPFWRPLADAYLLTGDERYTQAWVGQMQSWMAQDAAKDSPEQAALIWRSLEAAIRMDDTWPYAYVSFINAEAFTPDTNYTFVKSAMEHAEYLAAVLKTGPRRTGNWVANEALGLLTLAMLFPEWKASPAYREQALARLEKEMGRQVNADGSQKELSPWYHDVTISRFRRALDLLKTAGTSPSAYFEQGLRSMYAYERAMMDQAGNVPMFNDGLPLNTKSTLRSSLDLWDDPEISYVVSGGEQEQAPALCDWLPDAGYAIFRSGWSPDDFTLWFDAGPPGIEHFHQDRLGLILSVGGRELLTEAGHCIYDSSEWRSYALGTAAHNTLLVDGKQQHASGSQTKVENRWLATPGFVLAEGVYDAGYQQAVYERRNYWPIGYEGEVDKSIRHVRSVLYLEPALFVVWDRLLGSGHHRYEALFHFDAPTEIDADTLAVSAHDTEGRGIELYPLESSALEVSSVSGQTDPVLGWRTFKRHPLHTIIYAKEAQAPASFVNILMPVMQGHPTLNASATAPGKWNLEAGEKSWQLMLSPDGQTLQQWSPEALPELQINTLLGIQGRADDGSEWAGADGAVSFSLGETTYTLSSTSTVYFVRIKSANGVSYELQNAKGAQDIVLTSEDNSRQHIAPGGAITFDLH